MKQVTDFNQVIALLADSFGAFTAMLSSFKESDINRMPASGGWTAGEVASHIIKATEGIPDDQTEKADRQIDYFVADLKRLFLDFEIKMTSPSFILPDDFIFDKIKLINLLDQHKDKCIYIASNRDLNALCLDFVFPQFGVLTRYEWLLFIAFHVQRHTHQLKNIHRSFFVL